MPKTKKVQAGRDDQMSPKRKAAAKKLARTGDTKPKAKQAPTSTEP